MAKSLGNIYERRKKQIKVQIFTRNFCGSIKDFKINDLNLIGGAEIYLHDLSTLFMKLGVEVEIIQLGFKKEIIKKKCLTIKFIQIKGTFKRLFFPYFISREFSKLEDEDTFKVYNYPRYSIFRKTTYKNTIGIFHGVEWDTKLIPYIYRELKYRRANFTGLIYSIMKYIYFSIIVPYCIRKSFSKLDRIVSVDTNIFNYIKKKFFHKIILIPNYVDLKMFNPLILPIMNDKNKKIILVPRNLNIARGVHLIPRIVNILRKRRSDFIFYLVGTGPLEKFLEQQIRKDNLYNYIKLLGHINHFDLPGYYTASTLVLVPSLFSEGTSLAVLEGMACGKVVLTTDVGGIKEIGNDGITKIVISANPTNIAEKINILLDNGCLRRKIGEEAFKYVKKKFSKGLWEKKWKDLILSYEIN